MSRNNFRKAFGQIAFYALFVPLASILVWSWDAKLGIMIVVIAVAALIIYSLLAPKK